jgi:hypothetical protein
MRILCCGDRYWTSRITIEYVLSEYPVGTVVYHGACRGADQLAGDVARHFGFHVAEFPADWKRYGRSAGVIRNQRMLDLAQPDLVIAFHEHLDESRGTKHMIDIATRARVPVRIVAATVQET